MSYQIPESSKFKLDALEPELLLKNYRQAISEMLQVLFLLGLLAETEEECRESVMVVKRCGNAMLGDNYDFFFDDRWLFECETSIYGDSRVTLEIAKRLLTDEQLLEYHHQNLTTGTEPRIRMAADEIARWKRSVAISRHLDDQLESLEFI